MTLAISHRTYKLNFTSQTVSHLSSTKNFSLNFSFTLSTSDSGNDNADCHINCSIPINSLNSKLTVTHQSYDCHVATNSQSVRVSRSNKNRDELVHPELTIEESIDRTNSDQPLSDTESVEQSRRLKEYRSADGLQTTSSRGTCVKLI